MVWALHSRSKARLSFPRLGKLDRVRMAPCPPPTPRKLVWLATGWLGRNAELFKHAPCHLRRHGRQQGLSCRNVLRSWFPQCKFPSPTSGPVQRGQGYKDTEGQRDTFQQRESTRPAHYREPVRPPRPPHPRPLAGP